MTAIPMPLAEHEVARALNIARALAGAGVPMFVAPPCLGAACMASCWTKEGVTECRVLHKGKGVDIGFHLPGRWAQTPPDPTAVDRWQPGWALCAVGGAACDFIDTDPRNGGATSREQLRAAGAWPAIYGRAATPSGGTHELIAPLGTGKGTPAPGIDLQGGRPDGSGRGFVFLAPTVRPSKVDRITRPYRWLAEPDVTALAAAGADRSGAQLAELVRTTAPARTHNPAYRPAEFFCDYTPGEAERAVASCVENVRAHAAAGWPGFRDTLNKAAYTLGGLVATGWLSAADAEARLAGAITAAGHAPDDDDLRWIEEGIDDGASEPLWVRLAEPKPPPPSLAEPSAGNLPDEFWGARPILAAIRNIARNRGVSADAVLGVVLARLSSLLPGTLRVDTGIAMPAACNYYSILLGGTSAGKSAAAGLAESLFPMMYDSDSVAHPIGSGQGIAAAYGCIVDGEFQQNATKAFFYADEGATVLAHAKNQESIALSTLREAWTGKTFGQKNATASLNRRVSGYSLGMWMGLQPTHAAEMFSETATDDGTLARFVWFSTDDPHPLRTRFRGEMPRLNWDLNAAWGAYHVEIPDWIKDELWVARAAVLAHEVTVVSGQEHRSVLMIKTAVLLAIMDGRHAVNEQDWALAATVLDTSNMVAQSVRDAAAERARAAEERQTAKRLRALTADAEHGEKRVEAKIEKMVLRAIELCGERPGIGYTVLSKALSTREPDLARSAIARALARNGGLKEAPSTNGRGMSLWPQ